MTRSGGSPKPRSERSKHDDPPLRFGKCRSGWAIFDLASGDFSLHSANGETRLVAIAPTPADSQVVRSKGSFQNWSREEWGAFLREVKKFERPDLLSELEEIKDAIIRRRIFREGPVFDNDFDEVPKAVHSLLVHFSRSEGYLRVRGSATHRYQRELRSLGLHWNSSLYEWEVPFSQSLLDSVAIFVEKKSEAYDPSKIGYERCAGCNRWNPKSASCPCKSRV